MFLKNLQALRGIAVLLVVLYHSEQKINHIHAFGNNTFNYLYPFKFIGPAGVDLFFVISGFIITYTNFHHFGSQKLIPKYLLKRLYRIYPVYWLYTALALVLGAINPSLSTSSAFTSNIISSIFLLPQKSFPLLPVAWTLTYEILFYLLFGLMLCFDFKFFGRFLLFYSLVIFSSQFFLDKSLHPFITVIFNNLNLEFVFGCLAAILVSKKISFCERKILSIGIIWFGLGGIFTYWLETNTPPRVVFFGLPSALIVYALILLETKSRYIMPPVLQNIGTASYSTYLSHSMLLSFMGKILNYFAFIDSLKGYIILLTNIVIILLFGHLSFKFIEKPMIEFLQKHTFKIFLV